MLSLSYQNIKTLTNKHRPAAKMSVTHAVHLLLLNLLSWNTEWGLQRQKRRWLVYLTQTCGTNEPVLPLQPSLCSRKQLYQQHHFPCLCLLMPSSTSSLDPLYNGWTVNDIKRVWRHLLRKPVSDRLPKQHNVMSNDQSHTKSAPGRTLQMTKNLHKMPAASSFMNLNTAKFNHKSIV